MDKKYMGKIIGKDKLRLFLSALLIIFLSIPAVDCYASPRDIELLNNGYSYYLSYQPEKAVEEFRTFLKEFPQSSSRDTALYWLGMSLIQLKEFQDARKVFSDLKQQFPESPFSSYAEKELEKIEKAEYAKKELEKIEKAEHPPVQANPSPQLKNRTDGKAESGEKLSENAEKKADEDKEKKHLMLEAAKNKELMEKVKELEEEKKKADDLEVKVKELEKESKKAKELQEKVQELDEAKKKAEQLAAKVKELESEQKKTKGLQNKVKELEEEKEKAAALEAKVKELESEKKKAENLQQQVKELEGTAQKAQALQAKLKELDEANKTIDALQTKAKELEEENKKAKGLQEKVRKLNEEREKIGALQAKIRELEEEKKQTEALRSKVKELEGNGKKADELQAKLKELEEKKKAQELLARQIAVEEKKKSEELQLKIKELSDEKKRAEDLQAKVRELEGKESYLLNSFVVLNTLGMQDVLWRTGNIPEDLVNEKMLYEEAKKLNISGDLKKQRELTEKYKFNRAQEEYLNRYLTICNFIDLKLQDMPAENVFEQLSVDYDEDTRYTKIVLASELQKQAKSGMSFEQIYNLYPDLITFEITGFDELPEWIQEKVGSLPVGELAVVWSEEGYRILKRSVKKLALKSCEEIRPETREKIKSYITELLKEIKGVTKSNEEESGG